ncbi:LysR family transcriptional regulator [Myxococcus llanfairpwllgwyngyllgogerychwyrndrobwllllantysiliogogogochensis]|uniref:LysR family transcriptional regulator n=1 Tax=Myxococcus llanfairpwllgwyngyllgogerychwyrndrobwllllantysiliogogogochensis TaxID=2590453 RepID=A0A540X364_9BACT|nr:LysR family transcriptional regulator [Myxococcus llanfairpwllgwyngyllgogerychwyrndrobwllllantysiliogogogochensis]TQF15699.1 LysR family transcriptional regulator [Myxococcus llanfairpwllgwyngyllgogerychwyrndrobwllllantysiliogogogochensis]
MTEPLFDDLLGLACFARVVEHRSFTRAAAVLGVSKSVVSARVSRLESRVGQRLLIRTTRKLSVTDAGLGVYAHCARLLQEASAATRGASDAGRGTLRINAPISFAQMYLAGPLARFLAAHPGTSVEVMLSDRLVDLVEDRVDVALRITRLRDSSLVARKLATTALCVCASPAYLKRRGTPEHPEDLLRHDCLRYLHLRAEVEWRFYGPKGRIPVPVPVSGPLSAANGTLLREAVAHGIGLAVLPRFMVDEDLRSGRLVTVLDRFAPRPVGIHAVHAAGRSPPPLVRALLDVLASEFRSARWD